MNICHCNIDLDKMLCDIPFEWRKGIVKALCYTLENSNVSCEDIQKCQTLTKLYPFTLNGSVLTAKFKDENGNVVSRTLNILDIVDNSLDTVNPGCIMGIDEWNALHHFEKIQAIIDAVCTCCPNTTTTTSTTSTTTSPYSYYYAEEWACIDSNCKLVADSRIIKVPVGFIYSPTYFYAGVTVSDNFYKILGLASYSSDAYEIDINNYSTDCTTFCPTTTTSTTTTTTIAPTTTTTTTTSTTTTTTAPPPCVCHTYFIETAVAISFNFYECGETTLTNVFLGEGSVYTLCACEDNLFIDVVPGVTVNDLGVGCGGTTTTTTTTSTTSTSTTTTTTAAPTTTTSTTTTTTEAPIIGCTTYQITGTPSISVEWEDCLEGTPFSTTTESTINICARTGTLSQTGGAGTIVEGADCTGGTTTTTTSTSTSTTTSTSSSTTTTTTEAPETTTTTSTTTTTTLSAPGDNFLIINNSLDVAVASFTVDTVEVDTTYPAAGGNSESWTVSTSITADIYFEWTNTVGGQNVTIYDSNGIFVECQSIDVGDPTPFITWNAINMAGSSPVTIIISDGECV